MEVGNNVCVNRDWERGYKTICNLIKGMYYEKNLDQYKLYNSIVFALVKRSWNELKKC